MNKRVLNSLTELERNLVAETEKEAMAELDEDTLLALHDRIRRARTKYVKLYRREASAKVSEQGGRGKAYPQNQRNRDKAEIFELALARVSRRVDIVAKKAAAELRDERLAAARADKSMRAADGDWAEALSSTQLARVGQHERAGAITPSDIIHQLAFHDLAHMRQVLEMIQARLGRLRHG